MSLRFPRGDSCTLALTHCGSRPGVVSPTIFREGGFRFYFFSREESRLHIHVQCTNGEAKFWLEPMIQLAQNRGLNPRQLRSAELLIEEHADEIRRAWFRHFRR